MCGWNIIDMLIDMLIYIYKKVSEMENIIYQNWNFCIDKEETNEYYKKNIQDQKGSNQNG